MPFTFRILLSDDAAFAALRAAKAAEGPHAASGKYFMHELSEKFECLTMIIYFLIDRILISNIN